MSQSKVTAGAAALSAVTPTFKTSYIPTDGIKMKRESQLTPMEKRAVP